MPATTIAVRLICWAIVSSLLTWDSTLAGGTAAAADPAFKQTNTATNLQELFETIHQTSQTDAAKALGAFKKLMPDEERIKKALRDDISPQALREIVNMHDKLRTNMREDVDAFRLALPQQRIVQVHQATTEEIANYEQGSTAFNEFPGGAKQVAKKLLRPQTTFCEVEFLEPGKDQGVKYHLLYWDGKQWSMLGPVWRASP